MYQELKWLAGRSNPPPPGLPVSPMAHRGGRRAGEGRKMTDEGRKMKVHFQIEGAPF